MEPKHCLIGRKETSLIHVCVCELSINGNAYWLKVIKLTIYEMITNYTFMKDYVFNR